jgi:hypothetical protein
MIPIDFNSLVKTLETGLDNISSGFWNPLIWGIVIGIALLFIYIIRGLGKTGHKEQTEQTKVFLSGNPEGEKEKLHVGGSNVYWGFIDSFKWLYKALEKMHTGNVSDYILWFVVIMGILFIVMGVL